MWGEKGVLGGDLFDIIFGRTLENHRKEQKEIYETQIEGLRLKVDYLQKENGSLQTFFTEKNNTNENIRQEVCRLSRENSVSLSVLLRLLCIQCQIICVAFCSRDLYVVR